MMALSTQTVGAGQADAPRGVSELVAALVGSILTLQGQRPLRSQLLKRSQKQRQRGGRPACGKGEADILDLRVSLGGGLHIYKLQLSNSCLGRARPQLCQEERRLQVQAYLPVPHPHRLRLLGQADLLRKLYHR